MVMIQQVAYYNKQPNAAQQWTKNVGRGDKLVFFRVAHLPTGGIPGVPVHQPAPGRANHISVETWISPNWEGQLAKTL